MGNRTPDKVLSALFLAAVRLGCIPTNPCATVQPFRDAVPPLTTNLSFPAQKTAAPSPKPGGEML